MKILVKPGEKLLIGFADENGQEIDGEFTIHLDTVEHPKALVVQETAGLSGTDIGDANEVLYRERFGVTHHDDVDTEDAQPIQQPSVQQP